MDKETRTTLNVADYKCPMALINAIGEKINGVELWSEGNHVHLSCNSDETEKLVKSLLDDHIRIYPKCYQ